MLFALDLSAKLSHDRLFVLSLKIMSQQYQLSIQTQGRGIFNITQQIAQCVTQANVSVGLCHVFIQHTSASLLINEKADPVVLEDLERFMQRLVPDGDSIYQHTAEGADDMAAHVRSTLTASSLSIPITQDRLALGTWQGIFLWEHRYRAHQRHIIVTIS